MMVRPLCTTIFLMGIAAVSVPHAQAGKYHVSPDGADQNPGTAQRPWRSITHGIFQLHTGDTPGHSRRYVR